MPCKITEQQRIELLAAAANGEPLPILARRYGVSTALVSRLIAKAKDESISRLPSDMLDLYDVLKRKVGGKAARQMVVEHMQTRGIHSSRGMTT